jgi:hypothetical protein
MDQNSDITRRAFLELGTFAVSATTIVAATPAAIAGESPVFEDYTKFLDPRAKVGDLTESARKMVSRDHLLQSVLDKIPTPERVEQIHSILVKHIEAEEAGDTDATMATMDREPVFESIVEGKTYRGHQNVAEDYARRYHGLTRKLHITNLTVDVHGACAEMLWEGVQKDNYRGFAPVSHPKKFFIPMVVYYEVNPEGLIRRESVYYDQYLGALSLEVFPDILKSKVNLLRLNPGLIFRKRSQ